MRGNRRKLERQLPTECKRALGTDQQVGEVRLTVAERQRALAIEQIEVVAGHASQYLGNALAQFIAFAHSDAAHAIH